MDILSLLCREFSIAPWQAENTVALIDEGNTIPFIARYRKERTGSLDDQLLRQLADRLEYLRGLDQRREEIRAAIASQDKLTDELSSQLDRAETLAVLEDLYRPYRPKRRTRASIAREKGLEPLAEFILRQKLGWLMGEAEKYIDSEKGVETAGDALQGAKDIVAEMVSDDAGLREKLRGYTLRCGFLVTKATDPAARSVYELYYDHREPLNRAAGHRILAVERGEREGFLKVGLEVDGGALDIARRQFVRASNDCGDAVREAVEDGFSRLLWPSVEREVRTMLVEKASTAAIRVFSENLRQLLLQPPVKDAVTLGFDPGYRTGCKIAVVDGTGKVLDTGVVYPTKPKEDIAGAKRALTRLINQYGVTVIAIGNGTASRESESFIASLIRELPRKVSYMVVSEAGASVYSASRLAAAEFPDYDVSLRSAVSIARRLQDPLAELCKIDPKSIGVGQYQHDMPKKELESALDGVVEDCVNLVGVDLNTASQPLLSRVAGITAATAGNIVAYREEHGAFRSRRELLKVPKLGPKSFQQAAGFLRVSGGDTLLDNTGVHPESYAAAEGLLARCGCALSEASDLRRRAEELGLSVLAGELGVGEPTLRDIITELEKPGRDPRDQLPPPLLRTDVMEMSDLKPGMELQGTVRNIVDFGAFVDIGVHQDGLVHISQLPGRVRHPLEAVRVGDIVTVWVLSVDEGKKRISLTMRKPG